jgi:hypothetical protein
MMMQSLDSYLAVRRTAGFKLNMNVAGFNRRMRNTARPVVWEGAGAQSPALHPIKIACPTTIAEYCDDIGHECLRHAVSRTL